MILTAPLVVLIDDEPYQHQRVAELLPEVTLVSCYTAAQGMTRCAALRRQDARVALVLIDYRLPDLDGALLAAVIRAELPDTPFVAFSALPNSAALIGLSGALTFPPKGVDDATLGQALRAALGAPAPASPDPLVRDYLAELATTYVRQPAAHSVALLSGSRAVMGMLAAALEADRVTVLVQGMSSSALRPLLTLQPACALICDAQALPAGRLLAAELGMPLLCVTLSVGLAASLSVSSESFLVDPEPGALTAALTAMAEGEVYCDPQLQRAYAALSLTANERAILPHVLDDAPPSVAARALGCTDLSYGRARLRLLERLGVSHLGELRARIDSALM